MAGEEEILEKFQNFNSKIIFSAEASLWPDRSLKVRLNSQYCVLVIHRTANMQQCCLLCLLLLCLSLLTKFNNLC